MSAFLVDTEGDGTHVAVQIDRAGLDEGFTDIGGVLHLTLTNTEAAELIALLDKQIGEWAREMNRARSAVAAGVSLDEYVGRDPVGGMSGDALLHAADHLRKARRENG